MTTQQAVLGTDGQAASVSQEPIALLEKDYYGMHLFCIKRIEYLAGTIAQAEAAARQMVMNLLDIVDADLLLKHCQLPPQAKPLVERVQETIGCGDHSDCLAKLIDDRDGFVEDAIATHGRVHFLGAYGNQSEVRLSEFPSHVQCVFLQQMNLPDADPQDIVTYPWT